MKNLQNNYTTPKQSKRLLELGVPADSADCYYYDWAWIGGQYYGASIQICSFSFRHEKISHERPIYPCWSVGRLIEIELLCREKRDGHIARLYFLAEKDPIDADTIGCSNIIEGLIRYMESALYKYDFSQLEG